jgi:asparagine synthetase B (glutamine-hydrolysing)
MCSFIFFRSPTLIPEERLRDANRFAQPRGPDRTTVTQVRERDSHHVVMLHNLLDISGTAAQQPIELKTSETTLHALFNGEIYNFCDFGAFSSDTQCILPAWLQYGMECGTKLDGEYAIVIYDEARQQLAVLTDTFMTKPVYYGLDPHAGTCGVATCASSLQVLGLTDVTMCRPNSLLVINFSGVTPNVQLTEEVFEFQLAQTSTNFDAWSAAFLNAVERRARHGRHRPVVFLSSGYDSGAICLAMNLLGIGYDTFSIAAGENVDLLEQRIARNKQSSAGQAFMHPGLSSTDVSEIRADIKCSVEPFTYLHEDQPGCVSDLQHDGGALGAFYLANWARKEGRCVNLSGAGADEILSDYGWNGSKFYNHSQFGGHFPEDLNGFFPWKKFYDDTQRSYLFKDEFILGRWGVEGRYPFLDRGVVQAFLSLMPKLKNQQYKAPLEHFLQRHGYPFEKKRKRGFAPALPEQISKRDRTGYLERLLRWFIQRNQ